jgi:hypothetical protein
LRQKYGTINREILPHGAKFLLYGQKNFEKRDKYTIFASCIDIVYMALSKRVKIRK